MVETEHNFSKLLTHPATAVGDIGEFFTFWFRSRSWLGILLMLLPFFLLCMTVAVLIIVGGSESKEHTLLRYDAAAKRAAPIESNDAPFQKQKSDSLEDSEFKDEVPQTEEKSKEISQEAMLYFRRILQLEKDNKRARYYVAVRHESQGALAQARKMMETLAPEKVKGYEDAHVWLAVDLIRQLSKGIEIEERKLYHHLEMISTWDRAPPRLQFAHAQLIARKREEGWENQSRELVRVAVAKDKTLLIEGSRFVRALGNNSMADEFAERAILYYSRKLQDAPKAEEDRINLAIAHTLKSDWEIAKKVVLEGIRLEDRPKLRRLFSEICVEQYRLSVVDKENQFSADFGFLNEAINIDPWNPRIGEQIAILMDKEIVLNDSFQSAILKQIGEGKASPITYLILGSIAVKNKKFDEGVGYLQHASTRAPNWSLALNNYAMALTMVEKPDLEKATEIIRKAVEIDRMNAEVHDSLGRILLMRGDLVNAMASLDQAINLAPNRPDIREVMVEVCKKRNMLDMAAVHEKALAEILAKQSKSNDGK
ncbi:MAG: hypothetical protein U0905_16645 [Pirellulales bacterium]